MKTEAQSGAFPLLDALRAHAQGGAYPMHMPGHKRNLSTLLGLPDGLPWAQDVTEIHGFDDLHAPEGLLLRAMERAARLYGSHRSLFVVGGATAALLASIRALTRRGDKVLVARNSHQAVYHALELCGLDPVYVAPPLDAGFGVSGSIPPQAVADALVAHPDVSLVVITSPTYEGVLSDIGAISAILRARGVPLLVDEAHGAHLPFSAAFPDSALSLGADIVVHGLHKTLPCLTQGAMLHLMTARADQHEIERQLRIFETSSPSYPLMASIDACMGIMESNGTALLDAHAVRLNAFSERMCALKHLRVLGLGGDALADHPALFAHDQSKLLIDARRAGLSGAELMALLRNRFGFELEMSAGSCALAMTSLCDTDEALIRFADALLNIDAQSAAASASGNPPHALPIPECSMRIDEALDAHGALKPLHECEDAVLREYVWQYPPGVPLLTPGERVSAELIEHIARLHARGERVRSSTGQLPNLLTVVSAERQLPLSGDC